SLGFARRRGDSITRADTPRLAQLFETLEASSALNALTKPSSSTGPAPVMKDNRSERSWRCSSSFMVLDIGPRLDHIRGETTPILERQHETRAPASGHNVSIGSFGVCCRARRCDDC